MNQFLCVAHLSVLVCLIGLTAQAGEVYFPPNDGEWATVIPKSVNWDEARIEKALDFAGAQRSTGVVILHRGRILAERYWKLTDEGSRAFNERLRRNAAGHTIEDVASIQKSIVSILVGIAQEKGKLNLRDPVSKYLDDGGYRRGQTRDSGFTPTGECG